MGQANLKQGIFITLEGGDGCGKTTQTRLLAERLERDGYEVVMLSNHAATPAAAKIRELYLSGDDDLWSPAVEAFLLYGARTDMWERVVKPALAAGKIVVSDRFADSTYIYQGRLGGVEQAKLDHMHRACMGESQPDLTLIMDAPVEIGASRVGDKPDRFEIRPAAWHEQIRQGFLDIARAAPERCAVIDSTQPIEQVAAAVRAAVNLRIGL